MIKKFPKYGAFFLGTSRIPGINECISYYTDLENHDNKIKVVINSSIRNKLINYALEVHKIYLISNFIYKIDESYSIYARMSYFIYYINRCTFYKVVFLGKSEMFYHIFDNKPKKPGLLRRIKIFFKNLFLYDKEKTER